MKKIICFSFICIVVCSFVLIKNVFSENYVIHAQTSDKVNLPIIMYHSVLKSRQGKYIVSPAQLEQDFEAFKKMKYEPIFLREAVAYVNGQGKLPLKPIIISFDDGHYNNMHYVLPLLQKYNFKAVISPVTAYSLHSEINNSQSNTSYSYLTLSQLAELNASGLIEIGNHTHNMHKFKPRHGIKPQKGESYDNYVNALKKDIGHAQELITKSGIPSPITFAYPFGAYNTNARNTLLEMGFKAFLTCNEGISKIILGDPSSLYELKRYNRSGNTTTDSFIKKVFKDSESEKIFK